MATYISLEVELFTPEKGWKRVIDDYEILGHLLKRNYILFGILANEESDYEFVGENETKGVVPIVSPRGIPDDCDKDESLDYADKEFVKDNHNRWYPSWVTLKEVLEYKHWDTYHCMECRNYDLNNYQEQIYKKIEHEILEIRQISKRRFFKTTKQISFSELEDILANKDAFKDQKFEISFITKTKYRDMCEEFLNEFIPKLKELSDDYSEVRLVYYFW